jgi:hypothetical protein
MHLEIPSAVPIFITNPANRADAIGVLAFNIFHIQPNMVRRLRLPSCRP